IGCGSFRLYALPGAADERGAAPQDLERLGQVLPAAELLMAAEDEKIAVLVAAALHDAEGSTLLTVAKDREEREAVAMIDRIIAPLAANHVPAIGREKLVEFGAAEVDGFGFLPIIGKAQQLAGLPRHGSPSNRRGTFTAPVFLISPRPSRGRPTFILRA